MLSDGVDLPRSFDHRAVDNGIRDVSTRPHFHLVPNCDLFLPAFSIQRLDDYGTSRLSFLRFGKPEYSHFTQLFQNLLLVYESRDCTHFLPFRSLDWLAYHLLHFEWNRCRFSGCCFWPFGKNIGTIISKVDRNIYPFSTANIKNR